MRDVSCVTYLIFFAVSMPQIADLVLSIISFQKECKAYYIIRFVTLGINLIFIIILAILYISMGGERNPIGEGIISSYSCLCCTIAILPMEITSLVFFIKDYGLLFCLGKIGFYIHLGFIGLIILSIILILIWELYDYKHDGW